MFLAVVSGWEDTYAVANTLEEVKKLAVAKKKEQAYDEWGDSVRWTWDGENGVQECFGGWIMELKNGMAFNEYEAGEAYSDMLECAKKHK